MSEQATPPTDADRNKTLETANAMLRTRLKQTEDSLNLYRGKVEVARTVLGCDPDVSMVDSLRANLAERDELRRQVEELTKLVGAESPIAALDLATTWQAEKQGYMEQIEHYGAALTQLMNLDGMDAWVQRKRSQGDDLMDLDWVVVIAKEALSTEPPRVSSDCAGSAWVGEPHGARCGREG